jgi:hypothetical protein
MVIAMGQGAGVGEDYMGAAKDQYEDVPRTSHLVAEVQVGLFPISLSYIPRSYPSAVPLFNLMTVGRLPVLFS